MNRGVNLGCAIALITSCAEPFSNEDIVFLKSLPNKDLLRVDVPKEAQANALRAQSHALRATQVACPAEVSKTYLDTRKTSDEINTGLLAILQIVDTVTQFPPTERDDDLRRWTFTDKGKAFQLDIVRVRTATIVTSPNAEVVPLDDLFEYTMRARFVGDAEWNLPLGGTFAPIGTARRGLGTLYLDFDAIAAVDPDTIERGSFNVRYDTRGESIALAVDLRDFGKVGEMPSDGRYTFFEDGEDNGKFVFSVPSNVDDDPAKPALENLDITSRWRADRTGRGDVRATGGDLTEAIEFSECWDPNFLRTFAQWSKDGFGGQCGDVMTACAPEHQTPDFP